MSPSMSLNVLSLTTYKVAQGVRWKAGPVPHGRKQTARLLSIRGCHQIRVWSRGFLLMVASRASG